MLILNFLKELALRNKELNPTISMCYHMSDEELYIGNLYGDGHGMRLHDATIRNTIKCPDNYTEAFAELFFATESTEPRKVKCLHVDGMYFIPGGCDEAIIWAKDLEILIKNNWMIEGVTYEVIKLN